MFKKLLFLFFLASKIGALPIGGNPFVGHQYDYNEIYRIIKSAYNDKNFKQNAQSYVTKLQQCKYRDTQCIDNVLHAFRCKKGYVVCFGWSPENQRVRQFENDFKQVVNSLSLPTQQPQLYQAQQHNSAATSSTGAPPSTTRATNRLTINHPDGGGE